MLIGYIFEAMLAPPAYGGNPNGVGWQWLQHKAGYPLPKAGKRYYELPQRSRVQTSTTVYNTPLPPSFNLDDPVDLPKESKVTQQEPQPITIRTRKA